MAKKAPAAKKRAPSKAKSVSPRLKRGPTPHDWRPVTEPDPEPQMRIFVVELSDGTEEKIRGHRLTDSEGGSLMLYEAQPTGYPSEVLTWVKAAGQWIGAREVLAGEDADDTGTPDADTELEEA